MTKSQFEPITLNFTRKGSDAPETYSIPSDRVFGAICAVEEIVTLKELSEGVANRGNVSTSRLARAYAAALRYAGAKDLSDEDVYHAMFTTVTASSAMVAAINGLLSLMIPPAAIHAAEKAAEEETGKPGELQALGKETAVVN